MENQRSKEEVAIATARGALSKGAKVIALLIFVIIAFNSVIFLVPAGHAGVVFSKTDNGIKQATYGEGWHVKIPIIESAFIMEVRVKKAESVADAASKDLQDVQTTIALNYHPDKGKIHTLYQNVGPEYESRIIAPAIEEAVRAVTAKYTAEEMIGKRAEVSSGIKSSLNEKLNSFDIIVDQFSIVNFQFSEGFDNAIESKQVAEQDAQRETRVLDRVKILAEQKIAEADGQKKSAILRAEGEAQAKILTAEAEAQAIEFQGKALKNNPDVLQLRYIESWNGQVPKVSIGGDSTVIPMLDLGTIVNE